MKNTWGGSLVSSICCKLLSCERLIGTEQHFVTLVIVCELVMLFHFRTVLKNFVHLVRVCKLVKLSHFQIGNRMADSSGLCMIKGTDTKIMSILLKLLPIPRSRLEGKKGSRQLCGWWCRTPTRHRRKKTLKKLRDLPIGILEILIMPTQVRFQTFVRSALSIIRLCSAEKFIQWSTTT